MLHSSSCVRACVRAWAPLRRSNARELTFWAARRRAPIPPCIAGRTTANLDGETNLKVKNAVSAPPDYEAVSMLGVQTTEPSPRQVGRAVPTTDRRIDLVSAALAEARSVAEAFEGVLITAEGPNPRLYEFEGSIEYRVDGDVLRSFSSLSSSDSILEGTSEGGVDGGGDGGGESSGDGGGNSGGDGDGDGGGNGGAPGDQEQSPDGADLRETGMAAAQDGEAENVRGTETGRTVDVEGSWAGANAERGASGGTSGRGSNKDCFVAPIVADNILLRGATLRKVEAVYGVVIYTGRDTRLMRNEEVAPRKVSQLERHMNLMVPIVFSFQIVLCLISAIASHGWWTTSSKGHYYLGSQDDAWPEYRAGALGVLTQTLRFVILMAQLIPISLYISLECVSTSSQLRVGAFAVGRASISFAMLCIVSDHCSYLRSHTRARAHAHPTSARRGWTVLLHHARRCHVPRGNGHTSTVSDHKPQRGAGLHLVRAERQDRDAYAEQDGIRRDEHPRGAFWRRDRSAREISNGAGTGGQGRVCRCAYRGARWFRAGARDKVFARARPHTHAGVERGRRL